MAGVYNIDVADHDINVDVMSLVPGIELQIPVSDTWYLMPFAGFGAGKDTSGGEERYLHSLGIKHYVFSKWKAIDFTFGNTLRRDGFSAKGDGRDGSVSLLNACVDMRFPLGFNLFRNPGHLSIYGIYRHYLDKINVIYSDELIYTMDSRWELGITISSIPRWKIWRLPIERLGIGYRFGDGFSALRVVFGMPF